MHLPIAREGWPFILPMLGVSALGLALVPLGGWVLLALTGFTTYFFRDPPRSIPTDPGLLLAPADGKVVAVTRQESVDGHAAGTVVSIFLSLFDVHVNRAPVAGTVAHIQYQPGKFLPAFRAEASRLNEQNAVTLQTADTQVVVKQIAGLLARRIVCRVKIGDQLSRGQRFGLIRFGSRVDLFIPAEFTVYARPGQRVRGGESVLASSHSQPTQPTCAAEAAADRTLA